MVTKMLTLNTVHMTEHTLEILACEAALEDAGAYKEKEFPLIRVYCVGHPNISGVTYIIDADRPNIQKMLDENHIPDDLRRVLREAFVEWCDTIRLNDTGPVCASLPTHTD